MTTDPITLVAFLDPAAIGIVAGGTVVATLLRTSLGDVGRGVAALGVLARKPFDATPLVDQIAALGRIARRHGMHALDRSVIADHDVAAAVAGIVDGATPDEIMRQLDERRRARILRHAAAADMWAGAAEVAPAMGMIGTVVGLILMFSKMNDPAAMGPAMGIAMLTTLYGLILAFGIAGPIAARLERLSEAECAWQGRVAERLLALARAEEDEVLGGIRRFRRAG